MAGGSTFGKKVADPLACTAHRCSVNQQADQHRLLHSSALHHFLSVDMRRASCTVVSDLMRLDLQSPCTKPWTVSTTF